MPGLPLAPVDAALVRDCLAGNKIAWDTLVNRHTAIVMALARRYGLTPQDAEDIAQKTFERVVKHLKTKNASDPLGAWIARIARNLCISFVMERELILPMDEDLVAHNGDMQHSAEIKEVFERVARRLVGNEAAVWDVMTRLLTLNDETIAEVTGLDVATVHTTRMRVEKKAREEYDRQNLKTHVPEIGISRVI